MRISPFLPLLSLSLLLPCFAAPYLVPRSNPGSELQDYASTFKPSGPIVDRSAKGGRPKNDISRLSLEQQERVENKRFQNVLRHQVTTEAIAAGELPPTRVRGGIREYAVPIEDPQQLATQKEKVAERYRQLEQDAIAVGTLPPKRPVGRPPKDRTRMSSKERKRLDADRARKQAGKGASKDSKAQATRPPLRSGGESHQATRTSDSQPVASGSRLAPVAILPAAFHWQPIAAPGMAPPSTYDLPPNHQRPASAQAHHSSLHGQHGAIPVFDSESFNAWQDQWLADTNAITDALSAPPQFGRSN